jgi:transcriptional regulator with XRE-family HTH domain
MFDEFTQNRIAQLRLQKAISARDMSLSLGQNDAYINKIENKKALPSLQGLFYICEFFGISPKEFFDDGAKNPAQLNELMEDLRKLDDNALATVTAVVKEIMRK